MNRYIEIEASRMRTEKDGEWVALTSNDVTPGTVVDLIFVYDSAELPDKDCGRHEVLGEMGGRIGLAPLPDSDKRKATVTWHWRVS